MKDNKRGSICFSKSDMESASDPRGLVPPPGGHFPADPSSRAAGSSEKNLQQDKPDLKQVAESKDNNGGTDGSDSASSKEVMTFDEFINGTSFHGVRYIFDPRFFTIRRQILPFNVPFSIIRCFHKQNFVCSRNC